MSDEIDRAQEMEEAHRSQALKMRKPQLVPCGFCFNCGEAIKPGWLFCDKECRSDYEDRQAAKKRNGA